MFDLDKNLRNDVIQLIHDSWRQQSTPTSNQIIIGGSTVEGGMVGRFFQPTKESSQNKEIEVDFNILTATIPVNMKHLVIDKQKSPNIVNLQCTQSLFELITNEYDQMIFKDGQHSEYIETGTLKESYIQALHFRHLIPFVRDILAESEGKSICIDNPFGEITKAAVAIEFDVNTDNKLWVRASIDLAIMLKILWWPSVAAEWITRSRNWPPQAEVDELAAYAYIIAKPSTAEKDESKTKEFSYSFHEIETKLSQRRSPQQQRIYFLFKSLFYRYFKPIDKEHIPSFWAKSIMFWLMEKHPPTDKLWENDIEILKYMFQTLNNVIKDENLGYYFIPSINLLDAFIKSKGDDFHAMKETLMNKISYIYNNLEILLTTLPIEECYEFYENIRRTINNCSTMIQQNSYPRKEGKH